MKLVLYLLGVDARWQRVCVCVSSSNRRQQQQKRAGGGTLTRLYLLTWMLLPGAGATRARARCFNVQLLSRSDAGGITSLQQPWQSRPAGCTVAAVKAACRQLWSAVYL